MARLTTAEFIFRARRAHGNKYDYAPVEYSGTFIPVKIICREHGEFEDRQDLLGHKSERITTHYSAPELDQLLKAVDAICEQRPATVLRVIPEKSRAKRRAKKQCARRRTINH